MEYKHAHIIRRKFLFDILFSIFHSVVIMLHKVPPRTGTMTVIPHKRKII